MTRGYTPPEHLVKKCQVAVFVAVWDGEVSAIRPATFVQPRQNRGFNIARPRDTRLESAQLEVRSQARPERVSEAARNLEAVEDAGHGAA